MHNVSHRQFNPLLDTVKITVHLGLKHCVMVVDLRIGIDSTDVQQSLNFNCEQLLYLKLVGLKNRKNGEVIPMTEEESLVPETTCIPFAYVSRLEHKAQYDLMTYGGNEFYFTLITMLITADNRKKELASLSKHDIAQIRELFEKMDFDKNGVIQIEELRMFYDQRKNDKIAAYRKIVEDKIDAFPKAREKWEQIFLKRAAFFQKEFESNIELFHKLDVDNSGVIEWEEFLLHEAKRKSMGVPLTELDL